MSYLSEWFSIRFDDSAISLQVNPPGATARQATIAWEGILRVCFEAGDWICANFHVAFVRESLGKDR